MKHRKNEPESIKVGYIQEAEVPERRHGWAGQVEGKHEKSSHVTGAFPREYLF